MHLFFPHQMPFRLHQRCCGACLSASVPILKTPSFIMSQVLIWTAAGSVFFRESEAQGICSVGRDGFSELFVSASRLNWTLTSGRSESKGGETKSNA